METTKSVRLWNLTRKEEWNQISRYDGRWAQQSQQRASEGHR